MSEDLEFKLKESGKKLKDFTEVVDKAIPDAEEAVLKDPSKLNETLDSLMALEKKTRLAADVPSTTRIVGTILNLIYSQKKWSELNEYILLLSKKRAQLKKAVREIIVKGVSWIDSTPDRETRRKLICSLRDVSEGKLFAELERARLTRQLAEMEEEDGKVNEASELLQDIHVETVGSMELSEKAEFLLEQLRLCLAKKDFVRAEIAAKKVNRDVLEKEEFQELKLKFYNLMIEYYTQSNNFFETCQSYLKISTTPSVAADPEQVKAALQNAVINLVLSPFDNAVSDLLHRLKADKRLRKLPTCEEILAVFTTDELIGWPLASDEFIKSSSIFSGMEDGENNYNTLHKRVNQHNIRTVSKYYNRIRTERLAQLLSLDVDTTEKHIAELVSDKKVYAKIDRPAGIIDFKKKESPDAVLNAWSSDIGNMLQLVEKTCHLINREYIHNVK